MGLSFYIAYVGGGEKVGHYTALVAITYTKRGCLEGIYRRVAHPSFVDCIGSYIVGGIPTQSGKFPLEYPRYFP